MKGPFLLTAATLSLAVSTAGFAGPAADTEATLTLKKRPQVYIVQMASDPIAAYRGEIQGLAAARTTKGGKVDMHSAEADSYGAHLEAMHDDALDAVGGGRKLYDYKAAFNGFAAVLTPAQVKALKARGDVLNVWADELMKPQTNSTPGFLGLTKGGGPWSKGFVGEDIVIGMIDTGVQPDHPSLADVPTPKKGSKGPKIPYGKAPASFTGKKCQFGNTNFNPDDADFHCNHKLLKAEAFVESFHTFNPVFADGEFLSARDSDGHGTHTTTTAGGNYGVPASIDGEDLGMVSGMAPRARIASYKVCWEAPDPADSGCFSADSMAAIDQAVMDGVDVINFSIGGAGTNFNGADDIAFLFAQDAGVFVSVSAGNDGPGAQTIGTPSGVPWVTSVAAIEDNENFGTGLEVNSPASIAGIKEGLEGAGPVTLADTGSITEPVVSGEPLDGCTPLTNPDAIDGNIALIIRGVCGFIDKYHNAQDAGAKAIVVFNDGTAPDRFDPIVMGGLDDSVTIPGLMIGFEDGHEINMTADVLGTVGPQIMVPRKNRITGFSSRGPNAGAPDIIKPDVAAPGVHILAGETLFPNVNAGGGQFFQFLSGTSMASPHAAGIFALIKQAHPDWTAAMAKSALMTTADPHQWKTFGEDAADPFDVGAGLIQPEKAIEAGLAYDAGFLDYLAFLCGAENQPPIVDPGSCATLEGAGFSLDSSDLNVPSIGIAELVGTQTVTRTITNVGRGGNRKYRVVVDEPPGIDVSVTEGSIHLSKGESRTFEVTFTANSDAEIGQWAFGALTFKSGKHEIRSPIAVRPVQLKAPDEVRGEGTDGMTDFDVQFGYTGDYQVNVDGLVPGDAQSDNIADGDANLHFFDVPAGTTLARFALYDEDTGTGAGTDDLDLQVFGPDSADFPFLGQSGGPTSAEHFDVVNPAPGQYAAFVVDFATDPGPTPYTLFEYNLDGTDAGNTTVTTPPAVVGTTGTVNVEWNGLNPGTRYLGFLDHSDGTETIAETELLINTQ